MTDISASKTHDYYRNGTITLFAALDYLKRKVIAPVSCTSHEAAGTCERWLGLNVETAVFVEFFLLITH